MKIATSSSRDVVAGYYGFGNFGDDLFREILWAALSGEDWARPTVSQARSGRLDKIARNLRAVANIATARSLTLGGGSILGARLPFGIRHVEMMAVSAKRIPYCAVGVGLLENLPRRPDDIIGKMSWIGLRSEREYKELRPVYEHVHYTSDIAYAAPRLLLGGGTDGPAQADKVTLVLAGVGEHGKAASDSALLDRWIAGNLLPAAQAGAAVEIIVLQPTNPADAALGRAALEACARVGIDARFSSHHNALETLRAIASSGFVFTDRLHGAIVAHICGVPFRLSKHHQKCVDLLSDLGHPDAAPERSYAADLSGEGVAAVRDWSAGQADAVRRHAELAGAGIDGWLGHLEKRLN